MRELLHIKIATRIFSFKATNVYAMHLRLLESTLSLFLEARAFVRPRRGNLIGAEPDELVPRNVVNKKIDRCIKDNGLKGR